jgi:chromosome segregation ATPase
MANLIKMVPEFTVDDSPEAGEEPVKSEKAATEEVAEEEKETPPIPPIGEKPAEAGEPEIRDDAENLKKQVQSLEEQLKGLQQEKVSLLKEIAEARGQRREIKKEELQKVNQQIDELKDVHPDDVSLVDKILRSKGYLTKNEAEKMSYEAIKNQKLDEFLEKYPEYRPENDLNDINWNTLQKELAFYRLPNDPNKVMEVLERAHKAVQKGIGDSKTLEIRKQQLKTAGVGGSGVQKSSSRKRFEPEKRYMLERGGFTAEEIERMEARLE